ncbi:MAG: uncharacterized protein QG635_1814 [Bacteroidota bacterium]|nr:uncharacterized protein [Bacteroidota bacterium]
MIAPFFKFGFFGEEMGLVFAFIIGIGFGFFLEKAGFGTAKKLAAQFYFKDMTVLKVMFTAIVTAMLGIYFLTAFGIMDLSLINVVETNLAPQIVGGLLLGFGFVIGGYCPGTSVVACSTGKIDGVLYVVGVFIGIFIFGETFPIIEGFFNATPMGRLLLPDAFGISYGILVFAVVVMALGAFAAAEWAEKKFGYKKEGTL